MDTDWRFGPARAVDLLPRVYRELRRIAASKLAREPPTQRLDSTALVHEAWIRLNAEGQDRLWGSAHEYTAAAGEAMRRILIEQARRRHRLRHGNGLDPIDVARLDVAEPEHDESASAVTAALEELARHQPEDAEIVRLRFFVGLTDREIAGLIGVCERTVERHWARARAWLSGALREDGGLS